MTSDAGLIPETISQLEGREKQDEVIKAPSPPPAETEVKTEAAAPSAQAVSATVEAESPAKAASMSDAALPGEARTDSVAEEPGRDAAAGQGVALTPAALASFDLTPARPGGSLGDAEAALERRDYATARLLFQTIGRTDAAKAIEDALAALDRKDYAIAGRLLEALGPRKSLAPAEGSEAPKSDQEKPASPPSVEVVPVVEPDDRRPSVLAAPATRRGRKPLVVAAGLAILALLGAWALYGRHGGTVASAGGEAATALDSSGGPVKASSKPDVGSAAGDDGRSEAHDFTAALAQLTSRLDRIESNYGARLDQLGQRSDPNASARLVALSARLDGLEKKAAAPAPNSSELGELGTKLEKLEKKVATATPSAKEMSDLAMRVENLEKRSAPALDGPTKPDAGVAAKRASAAAKAEPPVPNGDARPGAKPVLRNYSVADVQDGFAVVESRYGTQEVGPGDFIPGAGRVLRIERRGGEWYVLTSNGVIGRGAGPYPAPRN